MKSSLSATVLIAAAAVLLGWRQERRIDEVKTANRQLASQLAASSGTAVPTAAEGRTKRPRHPRPDVAALANGLIDRYSTPEAGRESQATDLWEKLASLNREEFRELLRTLRDREPLDEEVRREAFGIALYRCALVRPVDALSFLVEFPDALPEGTPYRQNIVAIGLTAWNADDPGAALAWFRENGGKSPDFGSERAKAFLVGGIARTDPRVALQLFEEFGLGVDGLHGVLRMAGEETMGDAVAALRDFAGSRPEAADRNKALETGLAALGVTLPERGFDNAAELIAAADLSSAEMGIFADRLVVQAMKPADSGRWLDWLGENLPPEKAATKIRTLVSQWTTHDYQAAADWLDAAPPGPARDNAVRAWATTAAPYQPEAAARRLAELPAGRARQDALAEIHRLWPPGREGAKAAFAEASSGLE